MNYITAHIFEILKRGSLFSLIFFLPLTLSGQWDNSLFYYKDEIDSTRNKTLDLTLNHLSFIRNNEYFSPLLAGYTLFGFNTSASLVYRPHPRLVLSGGIYFAKNFGSRKISDIRPLVSVIYNRKSNTFIFGNLKGALNHDLTEPLYDFENRLLQPLETGIQYILDNKSNHLDTWIAWEENAVAGVQKQEQFTFGLNFRRLVYSNNRLDISASLQWLIRHKGGQISPASIPVANFSNSCIGGIIRYSLNSNGYIQGSAYGIFSGDYSPDPVLTNTAGRGLYTNLEWRSKPIGIIISYWNAVDFYPIQGGTLYSSYSSSIRNPEEYQSRRHLLFLRVYKDFNIYPDFSVSLRLEPFYDFTNKSLEHSLGVYFIYNGSVSLKK